jgi:hypothetical protein
MKIKDNTAKDKKNLTVIINAGGSVNNEFFTTTKELPNIRAAKSNISE